MCKESKGRRGERIAIIGGVKASIERTYIPHLIEEGATVVSYSEMSASVPHDATAVLVIQTRVSHAVANQAYTIATQRGLLHACVTHQWVRARPLLFQAGILHEPEAIEAPKEAPMCEDDLTTKVKSILGSDLASLQRQTAEVRDHQTTLETLLTEEAASRGKVETRLDGIARDLNLRLGNLEKKNPSGDDLRKHMVDLEERTAFRLADLGADLRAHLQSFVDQSLQSLVEQALQTKAPVPASSTVNFSTRALAGRIMADLEEEFPHALAKVDWRAAGLTFGVSTDDLIGALTALHEDSGTLDFSALALLSKCGWELALVRKGKPPVAIESPAGCAAPAPEKKAPETGGRTLMDQLVDAVNAAKRPLTVHEIVKATGFTKTQVWNQAANAARQGRIVKGADGANITYAAL